MHRSGVKMCWANFMHEPRKAIHSFKMRANGETMEGTLWQVPHSVVSLQLSVFGQVAKGCMFKYRVISM